MLTQRRGKCAARDHSAVYLPPFLSKYDTRKGSHLHHQNQHLLLRRHRRRQRYQSQRPRGPARQWCWHAASHLLPLQAAGCLHQLHQLVAALSPQHSLCSTVAVCPLILHAHARTTVRSRTCEKKASLKVELLTYFIFCQYCRQRRRHVPVPCTFARGVCVSNTDLGTISALFCVHCATFVVTLSLAWALHRDGVRRASEHGVGAGSDFAS